MLIILDGVNKAGKSTLANKIKEEFPEKEFIILKVSQPEIKNGVNQAINQYNEMLDFIEINSDRNYIIDRFHFGSFVYGPIYRGDNDFSYDDFYKLEERIMKLNYIFVLCISSESFMKKKFIEEKESFASLDKIKDEIRLFKKIAKSSRLMIFNHNLPKNDITVKVINTINQYDN